MTTEKSNQQYMTFEELAGLLLNFIPGQAMGVTSGNTELGLVYVFILGGSKDFKYMPDSNWEQDKNLNRIFQQIESAKSDSENPGAKEFLDYASIVIGARLATAPGSPVDIQHVKPEPIDMLRIFMKQIDNIKSDQVKYNSLKYLSREDSKKYANITHQILVKIAENPLATTYDLYKLQQSYAKDDPMRKKIFAEIEAKTQRLIEEEMKQNLPDAPRIRNAVATLIKSAHETGDMKLENEVSTTYNVDEILNPESGKKYVAEIEESKMEKIAQLQQKVDQLTRKLLDTQRGWNQTTEALKQLQIEKEAQKEELADKLEKSEKRTQRLIDATNQLQIGIGSRGIKKMRAQVEQIEQERRSKETR